MRSTVALTHSNQYAEEHCRRSNKTTDLKIQLTVELDSYKTTFSYIIKKNVCLFSCNLLYVVLALRSCMMYVCIIVQASVL
jgi:hypothetical protein